MSKRNASAHFAAKSATSQRFDGGQQRNWPIVSRMSDYRKLKVYQKARALARRMVPYYPRVRKRNRRIQDQLERAVEGIGDAIAEGRGRATERDFANFLTTAISSANEVEHNLEKCLDYQILVEDEHASLAADTIEVRKMLIGLRRTVRGA